MLIVYQSSASCRKNREMRKYTWFDKATLKNTYEPSKQQ